MPFLALLQILEKSLMKEILVLFFVFFLTCKYQASNTAEHVAFYWSLSVTVCMIFQMNCLNSISQIENNVSINSYNSNLAPGKFGQWSLLI